MKIFTIILMILGGLIVVGTAGASDLNPYMSVMEVDLRLMAGVSLFALGYIFFPKQA